MSEIDYKLDLIIEKLVVSKLDNSFLLGFSFLSILFSLANLVLADFFFREILAVGAIFYFLFSFYIGYFRGALRDNWGFRIWGWLWMTLSTAVIVASLVFLMILQSGMKISPTFPYGLFLIFASVASIFLVVFIKDMCVTTPALKNRLLSLSRIHRHFLFPFINSAIDKRALRPTYFSLLTIFVVGVILITISLV